MSTILVTGVTGHIGCELVHLLSLGPRVGEVRATMRDPAPTISMQRLPIVLGL